MAKPPDLYKISEAASQVPCSARFLRKHAQRGSIPHRRNSVGYLLFDSEAIEIARRLLYGEPVPAKKARNNKKNGKR